LGLKFKDINSVRIILNERVFKGFEGIMKQKSPVKNRALMKKKS